jgi:hypothetical protein
MKFNFEVSVSDYDNENNGDYSLQQYIIDQAVDKFVYDIFGSKYDTDDLSYQIQQLVSRKIDALFTNELKNTISNKVIDGLAARYEKSKQYKELINMNQIASNTEIKSGLKELVHELVKSEMKKVFSA